MNDSIFFEIVFIFKVFVGLFVVKVVMENKILLEDDVREYLGGIYSKL